MKNQLKHEHIRVLKALYDEFEPYDDIHVLLTFNMLASRTRREGMPPFLVQDVRRIVRHLRRRGYVELKTAWNEDDGLVCGSGHWITQAGRDYIDNLIKENYFDDNDN